MKLSSVEEKGQKIKKFDPRMQQKTEFYERDDVLKEILVTLQLILEEIRSK